MATQLMPATAERQPRTSRRARKQAEARDPGSVLKGHTPISGTTVHGKSALLIGLLVMSMGVFVGLMAAGVVPTKGSIRSGEAWAGALGGGAFVAAGLWLMTHGLAGILAQRRARRMREQFPHEPWRADFAWDDRGAKDMQRKGVRQMLVGLGLVMVLAAPFNVIMVAAWREGSKLGLVFGLVNLFVGLYVIAFFYRLARLMKYGTGWVAFRRFPFHVGEQVEVDYVPAGRLEGIARLTCTLRCIKEAYVTTQINGKTQTQIVSTVLHHQTREVPADAVNASHDRVVPLSFEIPPEGESTRLLDRPPVYWQLQVSAEARGVNLDSRFLVPIYARPGVSGKSTRINKSAFAEVAGIVSKLADPAFRASHD